MRTLRAVLAIPASAIVTAGAWGIAYGVANTPNSWNPMWIGFGALLALAGLLGLVCVLAVLLENWMRRQYGLLEIGAALCVALTTGTLCYAMEWQALHDHGRLIKAVVVSEHPAEDESGGDNGNEAILKDTSGHTLAGHIDARRLVVGDTLTVVVDPHGKYGVHRGPIPQAPKLFWQLAAALAVLQALLCAVIGFTTTGVLDARPMRT